MMRTCDVDGCDRRLICKGVCGLHYDRLRRTGSTAAPKPKLSRSVVAERKRESGIKYREKNKDAIKKQKADAYLRDRHITLPAFRARYKEDAEIRKRISEEGKKYREENREAVLARKRAYYANSDKEENNRKLREYRGNNKELVLEQGRQQRKKHKARIYARQRAWTKENKERLNETTRKARQDNQAVYLERDRKNREKNKDNIKKINRRYVEKYPEKRLESMRKHAETSKYAKTQLKHSLGIKNPPQELIELKRVQLKIHRLINRGNKI